MRYFLSCLLNLLFFCAFGQDPIADKMEWYGKATTSSHLFVHFDKNIYSNNENVYFTGYLLKTDSLTAKNHHVLSVVLIRDADSTVIQQEKFLMENGLAFGNIILKDSILTGAYHFIAYTDHLVNDLPAAIFIQPVTLKTSIDPFFKASMKLIDDGNKSNSKKLLISITSKDSRFLPKPTTVSYRYGELIGNKKTDLSGQLLLDLSQQPPILDPNVYVKLKYGNDSSFISMGIPNAKNKASVKFYPEGGNLVEGIRSTIAWEVKDQQKMPIALKAFLYRNNESIDTVETSSYGIGQFKMVPLANSTYTIKLIHSELSDSIYTLPVVLQKGLVLNLPKAIVNDTLRVSLKTNAKQSMIIRVHNFRACFISVPFQMMYNNQVIKIPLNEVPKGLATITITDSLDRPLAERIFFAHYDQQQKISITSDKEIYNQREKVSLKIKLTNPEDQGLVSIACIQNNRLDLKNTLDIASFTYLNSELNTLPANLKGNAFVDLNYLEQILLVKGWRRYNWQDLQQASEKMIRQGLPNCLTISGNVTHPKKKILKTSLAIIGGSALHFFSTDTLGHFKLDLDQLLSPAGAKLFLIFDTKEKTLNSDYRIKINDPYQVLNAKLAKLFSPEPATLSSISQNNQELILKNNERSIQLKEVVINPNGDKSITYNACGDYVCLYQVLNCMNHSRGFPGNKPAVKGEFYMTDGVRKPYKGCDAPDESIFFKVNPIYLNKQFYVNDFKDPLEPAFVSTIYWNYGTILTGDSTTTLDFYSSDITGKFRVVIQGLLYKGVVYAEHFFEVKGKQ